MGLDIWFVEDIRNALLAANEASSATAEAATSGSTLRPFDEAQGRLSSGQALRQGSGQAGLTTDQDTRTLDRIAKELREELPEGTSRALLDALHAAAVGNVDTLKHYRRGYQAALVTLALAFGLSPAIIEGGKPLKVPALRGLRSELPRRARPEPRRRVEGPSAMGYQPSAISHLPEKR